MNCNHLTVKHWMQDLYIIHYLYASSWLLAIVLTTSRFSFILPGFLWNTH